MSDAPALEQLLSFSDPTGGPWEAEIMSEQDGLWAYRPHLDEYPFPFLKVRRVVDHFQVYGFGAPNVEALFGDLVRALSQSSCVECVSRDGTTLRTEVTAGGSVHLSAGRKSKEGEIQLPFERVDSLLKFLFAEQQKILGWARERGER